MGVDGNGWGPCGWMGAMRTDGGHAGGWEPCGWMGIDGSHAGGWELMGMDGSHADGFCHAGGGGSNGIAAYRTDFRNGSYGKDGKDGKGKAWRCRIGRLSECNRFCMVPRSGEVQVAELNSFFCIGRCGDE